MTANDGPKGEGTSPSASRSNEKGDGNEAKERREEAPTPSEGETSGHPEHGTTEKGLTLEDLVVAREDNSGRASENVRTLCFAGIALVWVLANESVQGLSKDLLLACLAIVLTLAIDFAQYLVASLRFRRRIEAEELRGTQRDEGVYLPPGFNRPVDRIYRGKVTMLIAAYGLLLWAVLARLAGTGVGVIRF